MIYRAIISAFIILTFGRCDEVRQNKTSQEKPSRLIELSGKVVRVRNELIQDVKEVTCQHFDVLVQQGKNEYHFTHCDFSYQINGQDLIVLGDSLLVRFDSTQSNRNSAIGVAEYQRIIPQDVN